MPFPILKYPCYICGSAEKKFTPGIVQGERLTRCVGCDFSVKFYGEGISFVDGHDILADWVKKPALREPLTRCNASASGKRYFHQSCLSREQACALSYDNKYFHIHGASADQQHEELRNISHKLCGDCLSSAQRIAPDEHRLQHLKYEGVIDEEAAALKKRRADRRASMRRAHMEQLLTKLEADGTTSIAIFTTRPSNTRVVASSVADRLLTAVPGLNKVVLDVMNMQADGLRDEQARTASPDQAQCQQSLVATTEPEAPTSGQGVQGTTGQLPSGQEADADLVSSSKGFRLHKATNAELNGYLDRRGLPYHASSKPALRARVAADLIKNHHDGGLEPLPAAAAVSNTAAAGEQPDGQTQTAAPDQAQCQPSSVATAELEAPTTGQGVQQGTTRQLPSGQEADADLVSSSKGFRLHKATNAELKGYLDRRGLPYHASSKSALLARVAADLIRNHHDGGLEPPPAAAALSNTPAASKQPEQRRQKRPRVSNTTEVQQEAAMPSADQDELNRAY